MPIIEPMLQLSPEELYQIRLIRYKKMFHLQRLPNISPSPHPPSPHPPSPHLITPMLPDLILAPLLLNGSREELLERFNG
ncbi:hypothetical protein [Okeania sp. KiyG1]|uniref:hypothetical protein n=1 Tax=Okeania sp. KiyG1 TaxID=2720165 RepID=UPI00192300ED|nr:hypothetical protein [Okeania sp. KiyG1]